jgi:hypothetical protein
MLRAPRMEKIMQQSYDRPSQDVGNSVHLEHVNVTIPSQHHATLFYIAGLGLTRDPYMMVSDDNMWVNVGRSQFHLPTGEAQVLRGHTGLVISGRQALLQRLGAVRGKLAGTRFDFTEHNDHVEATCPWGNRIRVHEPDAARFGRITLGIPYVEFDVPPGAAKGIAAFYEEMIATPAQLLEDGSVARVQVGNSQYLVFRETDRLLPEFDEHHVQIYVADFSGPYRRLKARNLVSCEDNKYQYRFRDIVDLETGRPLFAVEHEVRSVTHPAYLRPLVNRNPAQTARTYAPGHDAWHWAMPPAPMDERP